MVLNALNIDPNRPWKGYYFIFLYKFRIWRWFSEEILHCANIDMLKQGLNLEQMSLLSRCNGLHALTFRPKRLGDEADFIMLDR